MKRIIITIAPVLLVSALTFCKSKKSAVTAEPYIPTEQQVTIAQGRWPGSTAEELQRGQRIYTTRCTRCHENYEVTRFTEKKWLHEIDEMAPKAQLLPGEKLDLTKYILALRDSKVATK